MKEAISGTDIEMDKGGRYFYHPGYRLTFYKTGSLPGLNNEKGMFVSEDGGDTFKFMYISAGIPMVAASQSNPKLMFGAGAMGSLLKSMDAGASWDLVGQNDRIRKTEVRKRPSEQNLNEKAFDEWPTDIYDIAVERPDIGGCTWNRKRAIPGNGMKTRMDVLFLGVDFRP
jgi:hypothetical protein